MTRAPKHSRKEDFFTSLVLEVRLIWRLFRDRRVPVYWKIIPVVGLGYSLIPFNILAPFDDIAIALVSLSIFVEVCPEEVVAEHRINLRRVIPGKLKDAPRAKNPTDPDE